MDKWINQKKIGSNQGLINGMIKKKRLERLLLSRRFFSLAHN
ncbi:hypothetical protein [Paenibacillus endoradicis]